MNKYAQNKTTMNGANSDIYIDIDEIPTNIDFKDITDLQEQINKYHSICKVININSVYSEKENRRNNKYLISNKTYIKIDDNEFKILK